MLVDCFGTHSYPFFPVAPVNSIIILDITTGPAKKKCRRRSLGRLAAHWALSSTSNQESVETLFVAAGPVLPGRLEVRVL
jgi:hypothetical protein